MKLAGPPEGVYNFICSPIDTWILIKVKCKKNLIYAETGVNIAMIKKYKFGNPFETEAVTAAMEPAIVENEKEKNEICLCGGIISLEEGAFRYTYRMADDAVVFGLGEANRGINKRGYLYESNCTDDPNHTEGKISLYGAHNFLLVMGRGASFGLFFDYPAKIRFDIGYTRQELLTVSCGAADLYLYEITGESPLDIVRQFRHMIGRSYIPPKFAFGYGQSRWGYRKAEDFREVVRKYRELKVPLDMVDLDIDYMDHYKDFTVNPEEFPDFGAFVKEMRDQDIHVVPIIDAGVKVEPGYGVYEEGVKKGYFCKQEDGTDFEAAVWPGWTHFPDVLNKEAREWFGNQYAFLTDKGVDAFWNDMNEPAIFYTRRGVKELEDYIEEYLNDKDRVSPGSFRWAADRLPNNEKDYESFYHNVNGTMVRHDRVHNLFGYNMTRAAGEAFSRLQPGKRILMFSRSSYIGMHRYGGVWTGDNKSWWSHILLNLKMLPSLNMCGFLYCGADLGGFGDNSTRDLLLRWLALGVFTPLMRNHTALGTREQEVYQFERPEDFKHIIGVRYRLIPYLYSEYMKAALNDDMLFKPLAFVYPEDETARYTEDQLLLGNELMIAPVYQQNAIGRTVYLPEEMMFVKFLPDGSVSQEVLPAGTHFVKVALNEVPLFIRKGKAIPVAEAAQCVPAIREDTMCMLGYDGAEYDRYADDGVSVL